MMIRCRGVHKRTMDHICAKAIYFIAVAYEKKQMLVAIRPAMFEAYKDCCLH